MDQLSPVMAEDQIKSVIVYASTPIEASIVQGLLENAGIPAFLRDDLMGTIFPWHAAPGGAGAVKVVVSSTYLSEAQQIVSQYENKSTSE